MIEEVDEVGRPIHARTVPLASAGSIGGVEEYVCTHCHFRSDLPDVQHACSDYGRDDSFTVAPQTTNNGMLEATQISRPGGVPKEYVVDWKTEEPQDVWRAVLNERELKDLRAEDGWHGEVANMQHFGVLGATTSDMDAARLRKFGFRHLRRM
jgi:hypothetical protein